MFEIVFLGTSASAPSVHRGLTSQVVLRGEHRFLIDAGEGTQRQILKSGLGFKRLDRILITHGHLDHILGLGGLISTFVRWEAMDKILIAAGKSALGRIKDLIFGVVLKGNYPPVEITLQPLETGLLFDEDKSENGNGKTTISPFTNLSMLPYPLLSSSLFLKLSRKQSYSLFFH